MSKKLTSEEVKKIAKLARLELTDEEVEKYSAQISAILDYVSQLDEVDTENVPITTQVTGLSNVSRDDEVFPFGREKDLIDCAPESDGNLVKVKPVF